MTQPRQTPERDSKYMGLAWVMASFSKDPSTQVGALIIDPKNNKPLGWGYNGPPSMISDANMDWSRPNKYDWIIHAEENAIDHSNCILHGTHLYVTHMPCKKCILKIVNQGIKRVIYTNFVNDPKSSVSKNNVDIELIEKIATQGGVQLELFDGNIGWIPDWVLNLKELSIFEISE